MRNERRTPSPKNIGRVPVNGTGHMGTELPTVHVSELEGKDQHAHNALVDVIQNCNRLRENATNVGSFAQCLNGRGNGRYRFLNHEVEGENVIVVVHRHSNPAMRVRGTINEYRQLGQALEPSLPPPPPPRAFAAQA